MAGSHHIAGRPVSEVRRKQVKAMPNRTSLSTLADTYPLLGQAVPAVLTTVLSDGRLQSTIVWFACDREDLLVFTMREFAKARNLLRRPVANVRHRQ